MTKSQKEIAEEIDSHIHAIIEKLVNLHDMGDSIIKESLYGVLCDLERWVMVEWSKVHNVVGLGPFCIFKEKVKP